MFPVVEDAQVVGREEANPTEIDTVQECRFNSRHQKVLRVRCSGRDESMS